MQPLERFRETDPEQDYYKSWSVPTRKRPSSRFKGAKEAYRLSKMNRLLREARKEVVKNKKKGALEKVKGELLKDVRIGLSDGSYAHFAEVYMKHLPNVGRPEFVSFESVWVNMQVPYSHIEHIVSNWSNENPYSIQEVSREDY